MDLINFTKNPSGNGWVARVYLNPSQSNHGCCSADLDMLVPSMYVLNLSSEHTVPGVHAGTYRAGFKSSHLGVLLNFTLG